MIFFKPKHKSQEILPPPPPFPTMNFDEVEPEAGNQMLEPPKFFDETIDEAVPELIPEVQEFDELVRNLDKSLGSKSFKSKSGKKAKIKNVGTKAISK